MKKRFTDEQIIGFLREAEAGVAVKDLCRRHGFSEGSYYQWRSKFGGMSVPDAKRLRELETENTRLKKLDAGEYDAIILASAGLKRLGFADRITDVLPAAMCLPAVGQGALAIETRADDAALRASLAFLQDEDTVRCARAERSFLRRVEGGCQVPVGVYASPEEAGLRVEAVIASLDGRRLYRDHLSGAWADAEALGKELADKLLAAGGLAIMHELGLLLDRK